jgi:ATP-dependent DNA helicase RecQ
MTAFHSPEQVLKEFWGFDSFRSSQSEIIASLLEGNDTLAILPTGGGKSICFQVPALMKEGCCLVISPLIALMEDQVQRLQSMGIPARAITSGLNQHELEDVLDECINGKLKFLYVSPERLETRAMLSALPDLPINLIAVDESHCISQWGYDFRPSYLNVSAIRPYFRNIPLIALTASATNQVKDDILQRLTMKTPKVFMNSFSRENINYRSIQCEEKTTPIITLLREIPGSAIIYCRTRRRTTELSDLLQQHGFGADHYHAGLDQELRKEKQQSWITGGTRIMVCTNAFGMGIDKPDVRLVLHADIPDCLENYYQEAGRAGRDGKESYAILLYRLDDLENLRLMPAQKFPPMATIRKVYHALANHHQVPAGAGAGSCYELNLEEFMEKFKLALNDVINSLQTLKQEHIIHYLERVFMPSTVQFLCGREYMEQVESEYPELEPLIKILLRTYSGIYDVPVRISEKQIAWKLNMVISKVVSDLIRLNKMGIISFTPKKESPQICYIQDRVRADELEIDHAAYQLRKKMYEERVEVMIRFATDKKCKSIQIGNYFGDESIPACGKCDNCLKKAEDRSEVGIYDQILTKLLKGPLNFAELKKMLPFGEKEILNELQFLKDQEKIKIDDGGKIAIK